MGNRGESVPMVIEWVDRADRIHLTLPHLDEMLPDALITIESIGIYRATLRSRGPFSGDQNAGDIMQTAIQTVTERVSLGKAIALMLAYNQTLLPVVDEQKKIVGILTELDIVRRGGLRVPLRLLPLLTKEEGNELLAPLANTLVSEVMSREWRSVPTKALIPQALMLMIEWDYIYLPVLDTHQVLQGLLSWSDVLSAVISRDDSAEEGSGVRDADEPTPVSLVMQSRIPQIEQTATLGLALQRLLESPDRYLVVVDERGYVQGSVSDVGVFQRLSRAERAPLLAAMQQGTPLEMGQVAGAYRGIEVILERNVPTIAPRENIVDAIHRLMNLRLERAPVVDEDGRLVGIIARGGLLRALTQESR
ncbi:MAG: CBS domain-containing protein [Chloroflexaceae bacterium]|nr:CBS domain-containing protein [Chloroflexaceae bacterium]